MTAPSRLRLLTAAALIALATGCETAGSIGEPTAATLSLRGKIGAGMADQLAALMPRTRAGRLTIHLASGGGDFGTALKMAQRLEALPHSTAIVTQECDSACVIIFVAARERLVDRDAVFAVHRPQCTAPGLRGLPCRVFWEPWASTEFHWRIARVSRPWADYLDAQEPPAFARRGADSVRVTGEQLIAFGAATALPPTPRHAALGLR
jgi:hypothetical protein